MPLAGSLCCGAQENMAQDVTQRWMKAAARMLSRAPAAPAERREPEQPTEVTAPFRLRDQLLSGSELTLFRALEGALGDVAVICPKPRLTHVLSVNQIDAAVRAERKTIDLLVCDREGFTPCVAVLLERWDESRQSYEPRDTFLERVLFQAQLPVVHVRSDQTPSASQLRERLLPLVVRAQAPVRNGVPLLPR